MYSKIISYIKKPKLLQRLQKKIKKFFFIEQWALLVAKNKSNQPSWEDFKFITPPKDRFWADPFLWRFNNEQYIFYEELPFKTKKGHISCIKLGENLEILSNEIVLDRPYHLSYPYLFEYQEHIYMLPETKENHCIEVYQCTNFPNQWERKAVLINKIDAVDSTLLEYNGKWWLFTNVVRNGGNAYDSLNLYYSDTPLSDLWTPHPLNPIIQDIKRARPAGKIIKQNGVLIRPSQDCSTRYGYATNFNRIDSLTELEYKETYISSFSPPPDKKNILSTHTWNQHRDLYVIDAELLRKK